MRPPVAWLIAHPGAEVSLDVLSPNAAPARRRAACSFPLEPFAQHCLLNGVDELGYPARAPRPRSRRYERARMKATIAVLAGDGIGPEVIAEGVRCLRAIGAALRARVRAHRAPLRRRRDRCHGDPLPPATLSACLAARCGAARGHRRTEVVGAERARCARKPGCSACAARSGPSPTCARCRCTRRSRTPRRSSPRSSRGRPGVRARADRRHLFRREGAQRRACHRPVHATRWRRSSASRASPPAGARAAPAS